jgi:uncharacterized protein (DUF433 family)
MNDFGTVIAAFSEDHVNRLTGVTKAQLRYWDRTKLFSPEYADRNRRLPYSRVYSFRDIVSLRVLHVLRNQYSVSLQQLRKVSERLADLAEDRWTGTRLWVLNKNVIWEEPGTGTPQEIVSQQYVMDIPLHVVIADARKDIAKMNVRDSGNIGQIERERHIFGNAPIISGTRIPVQSIKSFADAGFTVDQILAEYPGLTKPDIQAALSYGGGRAAA